MIVRLEPVDGVQITTLMDNYSDALLPNEGPAKRAFGIDAPAPRIAVATFEGGESRDSLMAEHGFSALVTVSQNGRGHTILFDSGVSPNGLVENMRRLNLTPKDAETIVLALGSVLGTIQETIDELREDGLSIGAVGLKCFRPFPAEEVAEALAEAKRVVVFERAFSVGAGAIVGQNVRTALAGDTVASLRAYRHFLALTYAADSQPGSHVQAVRAALARLQR